MITSKQAFLVLSDAHDMGDDWGQDPETALVLARAHCLDPVEVQKVLNGVDNELEDAII
jgi:hypothetical protein